MNERIYDLISEAMICVTMLCLFWILFKDNKN